MNVQYVIDYIYLTLLRNRHEERISISEIERPNIYHDNFNTGRSV